MKDGTIEEYMEEMIEGVKKVRFIGSEYFFTLGEEYSLHIFCNKDSVNDARVTIMKNGKKFSNYSLSNLEFEYE